MVNKVKSIGQFIKNYIKNNKIKSFVILFVVAIIFIFTIANSLATLTPVKSFNFTSNGLDFSNNEEGSYKVTKSYKWLSTGKIKVTVDIETPIISENDAVDVLLAVDTSNSMTSTELTALRTKLRAYAQYLSGLDSGNQLGLVFFNDTLKKYDFTHTYSTLNTNFGNMTLASGTSYYFAFKGINDLLNNYTPAANHDLVIVFLVNGVSTADRGIELYQYRKLLSEYPNIKIKALYYQTNKELTTLDDYFDEEIVVDDDNLEYILKSISVGAQNYETFTYTDSFDSTYFTYENNSLDSNFGTTSISNNTITYDLSDGYYSGTKAKLEYVLNLKNDYLSAGDNYQLNPTGINIVNDYLASTNYTDNIVVGNSYTVTYEANSPSTCTAQGNFGSTWYNVGSTVTYRAKPTCAGYKFNGWEVTADGVNKQNDENFVMPDQDVTVKAKWSKVSTVVSMDGEVTSITSLYDMMADNSLGTDSSLDFSTISTAINGKGVYTIDGTENDQYPIYYYRGNVTNNYVIFGGKCWQIVRTTDTGGVRIVYAGTPNSSGQCATLSVISGNVSTAHGYKYNSSFYGASNGSMEARRYWYDYRSLKAIKTFSGGWWKPSKSVSSKTGIATSLAGTQYYYASSGSWNSSNQFVLTNAAKKKQTLTSSIGSVYTCFNSSSATATCNPAYYVMGHSYNLTSSKNTVYYISLSPGETRESVMADNNNVTYYFGKDVSYDPTNQTYDLVDYISKHPGELTDSSVSVIVDMRNDGSELNDGYPYICESATDYEGCSVVYYLYESANLYGTTYKSVTGYKLTNGETAANLLQAARNDTKYYVSNDVSYDNGEYTLINPEVIYLSDWDVTSNNPTYKNLLEGDHHYFCKNSSTCESVMYAYYSSGAKLFYYTLSGGTTIEDYFDGDTDSTAKSTLETWYTNNLLDYSSYIEDSIYCNDTSLSSAGGLDKDTRINTLPQFNTTDRATAGTPNLTCTNARDRYTVSNAIGNGKLTQPIGLLTSDEYILAGASTTTANSTYYLKVASRDSMTMSPATFNSGGFYYPYYFNSSYKLVNTTSNTYYRPVITLKPGTKSLSGVGTTTDPYVIGNYFTVNVSSADAQALSGKKYWLGGSTVTLEAKNPDYRVISFNLDGTAKTGNTFTMPNGNAVITDVVVASTAPTTIESEHNPYPNNLSLKDYGTVTYPGATKLSIQLTYGTYNSSDKVFLYSGSTQKTSYSGQYSSPKTVTYTMTGNTVTFKFTTNGTYNNYYGFKAVVTPVY